MICCFDVVLRTDQMNASAIETLDGRAQRPQRPARTVEAGQLVHRFETDCAGLRPFSLTALSIQASSTLQAPNALAIDALSDKYLPQ